MFFYFARSLATILSLTRKQEPKQWRKKRMELLLALFSFLAGTVFGVVVSDAFVRMLPSPKVKCELRAMKPLVSNAIGSTVYTLSVRTNEHLEHIYARISFPHYIDDFKIGHPEQAVSATAGELTGKIFAIGKQKGKYVVKADMGPADVQASAAGNTLVVQWSKAYPGAWVFGLIATSDAASMSSDAVMKAEGTYEYVRFNQTVRRKLNIEVFKVVPLE
jgi:hypothetical protein